MYAKVGKPKRKLTQLSSIEYNLKSCQVKTTIGNCTDVWLKMLKILTTHRRDVDTVNQYVKQLKILNKTRSVQCIRFRFVRVESSPICFRLWVLFNLSLVHIIESSYTQTQNYRNVTQHIHRPHTDNTQICLSDVYLVEISHPKAK